MGDPLWEPPWESSWDPSWEPLWGHLWESWWEPLGVPWKDPWGGSSRESCLPLEAAGLGRCQLGSQPGPAEWYDFEIKCTTPHTPQWKLDCHPAEVWERASSLNSGP